MNPTKPNTPTKPKKKSIREFVSEEELKFQLYLLKFSQQLNHIKTKTKEEIISQFNDEVNKRLNLIKKDKEKYKKDIIAQDALTKNETYVKSWKAPTDSSLVFMQFEEKRKDYINFLKEKIQNENRLKDKEMLEYVENVELNESVSKEKFGQILLLMIKNMATMPSFGGYTENWKTDFFSNAIEKTLLYAHNFDENLLSRRTGNKSKAFAYVTQICFNAFVNVINIRKAESEFLKDTISFNTSNVDGVKTLQPFVSKTHEDAYNLLEYIVLIDENDNIKDIIESKVKEIKESNEIISMNKNIQKEIRYLKELTPLEEQNSDFETYINELAQELRDNIHPSKIEHLIFQKPKGMNFKDGYILPSADFAISVRGPIEKNKEIKKTKRNSFADKEKELKELADIQELAELRELEDFNNEWGAE